jgi:pyruvate carboxylase subunit A
MGAIAANGARLVGYEGAGTMEFLFTEGKLYFMEVNARVQVEHPVTEMVTGVDIVKEGIRIASGLPLSYKQEDIRMNGNAIECRINAEDPMNDFVPTPGRITSYHAPGGTGIRVDSGVYTGYTIPPFYDPMISKLIVWGGSRDEAIKRMRRALWEYVVGGPRNNIPFHKAVMENPRFISGDFSTYFIEGETGLPDDMKRIIEQEITLEEKLPRLSDEKKRIAAIAAAVAVSQNRS